MPFVVMLVVSLAAGLLAWAVARRLEGHRPAQAAAREVDDALGDAGVESPAVRTGAALTAAVVCVAVAGVVLGALSLLVRRQSAPASIDRGAADWAHDHAVGWSTDLLTAVTDVGQPWSASAIAAVFAVAMAIRMRDRWIVPFMLLAVGGTSLLTTLLKVAIDRVRPTLNPLAETLGPSFPSGHTSYSAATFAAMALVLGRSRDGRTRAVLAGAAVALAVAVGATRVLLRVHWVSDVVAGLALGWAWFAVSAVAFGGRILRFGAGARRPRPGTPPGSSSPPPRGAAPSR